MDAYDPLVVLYLATGVLALGCAILPGTGTGGRVLCTVGGLAFIVWAADVYLLAGRHPDNPAQYALPLLPICYGILALRRNARRRDGWLSPAYGRSREQENPDSQPPMLERRSVNRRRLPGEYGDTPLETMPPPHDPWAALYASVERELLRGQPGRHRPQPIDPAVRVASVVTGRRVVPGGAIMNQRPSRP